MFLSEFSYLRKTDRMAIVALLIVAIVSLVLLLTLSNKPQAEEEKVGIATQNDSVRRAKREPPTYIYATEGRKVELVDFDPNTADSTTLLRLGLSPWQVKAIYKYRAHGGIFREPSDFARLHGLTEGQWRQLAPHIHIGADFRPVPEQVAKAYETAPVDTTYYKYKLQEHERVDINQADTTLLKRVPGIGSYFATQIVWQRERLGGFTSISQLNDITGFPEHALRYFVISDEGIRRLNVNTLTLSQLRRHPYINFYQARAIIDFRRLKGRIDSLDDLRRLPEFSEKDIERLTPYLSF